VKAARIETRNSKPGHDAAEFIRRCGLNHSARLKEAVL